MKIKEFLFNNIGLKQTIVKNTFWLTLAEIVSKGLSLVLVIYIIRILGALEYGKFIFALSFVSVMSIFSDLGVMDIATREFSRNKDNEKKFASIFTLEVILCLLTLGITIISSFFITSNLQIQKMMWTLTIFVLSNSLFGIIFSFLRARQNMEYEAIIKVIQSVVNTLIIFLVIFFIPSAQNLSYGYLLSTIIVLLVVMVIFSIYAQPIFLKWEKDVLKILKMSWPLSFGFMAGWIYISINSVILGYFGLITENGWYGAASKIAIATIIPANLIIKSFYPILSNFFVTSKDKLQKAWDYFIQSMVFLALPLIVGFVVLAPRIVYYLYGSDFTPSILALQLMIFIIGINLINYPYTIMLVVADKQKVNFLLIILGGIVNIVLNFILIPRYGFYGSIIATIIASVLVFLLVVFLSSYYKIIEVFNKKTFYSIVIASLASFLMYLVINYPLVYGLNIILVGFIGFAVYSIILFFIYKLIFRKKLLSLQ